MNRIKLEKKEIDFLEKYIDTPSPVGFEYTGQKVWIDYVKEYADSVQTDPYGTAIALLGNAKSTFKVVIEAHVDEISWFVNYIASDGLIYVKRNGGTDAHIAPGMRVNIHGKKGIVKGAFGWPAIHTRSLTQDDLKLKVENLFIDCGARNKEQAEQLGIHVGSVITYQDGFDRLANNNYIGRAFDNRIGGFMIAQVLRFLKQNKISLPYNLFVVNAVQEEIGLAGALMAARRIKPDIAIVTDVTHDTSTPHINQKIEGELSCGKGPTLTFGPAVHNKLNEIAEKVALREKIPFQYHAVSRSTGTDTDSFAYANDGCPSVLLSIPLRYMHTTVEMLHHDDIENTIKLMYALLLELKPTTDLSYFK